MQIINGYELQQPLTSKNAGTCLWSFCSKDGRLYFIKKFLAPHYPDGSTGLSPATLQKKIDRCAAFYVKKRKLYDALLRCRTGNVIVVEDFFRWGFDYYAVTELVNSEGGDPAVLTRLSMNQKRILLRAVSFSLCALHKQEIVHADLKPENILLVETEAGCYTGKIIDFDSSYFSGSAPEELQGDPVYLAPETFLRMNGQELMLTKAADIFALGLICHQYITGSLPKISSQYHYAFESVLNGEPLGLSAKLPSDLLSLIGRMLSCDPKERPDAEQVFKELSDQKPEHQYKPFSQCGEL